MVWNNELEDIAQRWADQCDFGHDHVRNKIDGTKVGQNAYIAFNSRKIEKEFIKDSMRTATESWYDEVKNPGFDPTSVENFRQVLDYFIVLIPNTYSVGSPLQLATTPKLLGPRQKSLAAGWSTTKMAECTRP